MKKFDFKLTFALVSLFIGLIFIAFGSYNKYLILTGCIILSVSCLLFVWERWEKFNETMIETERDLQENEVSDEEFLEIDTAKLKLTKSNRKLIIGLCLGSVLFIIIGICSVIG